jgi:PAS domain-containing protein
MTTSDADENETIEALARYRYSIIRHVTRLIKDDSSISDGAAATTHALPGLLASSLEALRVAEEELRSQNATLLAQRAKIDERTRYYRELFLQSPVPTLVTDIFGTIFEGNLAAGRLVRRAPDHLVRKPLAAIVPTDRRDEFRRQFALFLPADGPREWRFTISRVGDVPLEVRATVQFVVGLGPTSSGVLYWLLSPNESWAVLPVQTPAEVGKLAR